MDSNQIRVATLRALTPEPDQFNSLKSRVAFESKKLGFINDDGRVDSDLALEDLEILREVFWSFIIQGIIFPGHDAHQINLPFFRVTDYGKRVISQGLNTPHDPDGFLKNLSLVAPNVDETAYFYIAQSLECFVRGLNTPSAVMLGVATEHLIKLLAISLGKSMSASLQAKFEKSISNRPIRRVFEETLKRLEAKKKDMPSELADGLDHELTGLFALIRKTRNSAGHPTGQEIDQLTALGLLSSFPLLCRQWSTLVEWLSNGKN